MVITNAGAQAITYAIGSNISNNYIQYCAIGTGSGTALVTESTLINEVDRNPLTGSPNFAEARKVQFQSDFNSFEMSGVTLTEFGFTPSGASQVGSIWQIERIGSIVFDGTNELQVISTLEVLNA